MVTFFGKEAFHGKKIYIYINVLNNTCREGQTQGAIRVIFFWPRWDGSSKGYKDPRRWRWDPPRSSLRFLDSVKCRPWSGGIRKPFPPDKSSHNGQGAKRPSKFGELLQNNMPQCTSIRIEISTVLSSKKHMITGHCWFVDNSAVKKRADTFRWISLHIVRVFPVHVFLPRFPGTWRQTERYNYDIGGRARATIKYFGTQLPMMPSVLGRNCFPLNDYIQTIFIDRNKWPPLFGERVVMYQTQKTKVKSYSTRHQRVVSQSKGRVPSCDSCHAATSQRPP